MDEWTKFVIEETIRQEKNEIAKAKKQKRIKILLLIGKWIADNIVAIGALTVAIIALIRTF